VKRSNNVQKAAQIERLEADQKQKVDEPHRRFKRRQGDRRRSVKGMRLGRADRRKSIGRGDSEDDSVALSGVDKRKTSSRKGRIIDERA